MSALREFVEARRESIVARWTQAAQRSAALSMAEGVGQLRGVLQELAEALRTEVEGGPRQQGKVSPVGSTGAAGGRPGEGQSPGEAATAARADVPLLGEVLLEMMEEASIAFTARELRVLLRHIASSPGGPPGPRRGPAGGEVKELAFLAHELRNPLSSARLALSLIKGQGKPLDSHAGQILEKSLIRLGELIDESLVAARMEGGAPPDLRETPLSPVLERVAWEAQVEATTRRISVVVEVEPGARVQADERLLRSAVSNLLRNALKFTREGGRVGLRARTSEQEATIEVEDECGGLPFGTESRLFELFTQASADRSGFGLGLAIAKRAIEGQGGSITIRNLPGKGCIFTIHLPPPAGSRVASANRPA